MLLLVPHPCPLIFQIARKWKDTDAIRRRETDSQKTCEKPQLQGRMGVPVANHTRLRALTQSGPASPFFTFKTCYVSSL